MSRPNLILSLAKVIIAAAWADGDVDPEEINSLKDLLFRLPELTGREWAMLEMYIEAPIGARERDGLVMQLQAELATPADKALALSALDELIHADGIVTETEKTIVEEIKTAIEEVDVSLFGQLARLIQGPVTRRSLAAGGTPNREEHFEDFIKNKVFYEVRRRMELGEAEFDIPEADLRKLSLAGGLMARVAHVDREIQDSEINYMIEILVKDWDVKTHEAAFIAEIALNEASPDLDYYRLTRRFFESTSAEEREAFLDVLFDVAAADGFVSNEELEEIRTISNTLKLTHRQYINAKLKIPRELRAT